MGTEICISAELLEQARAGKDDALEQLVRAVYPSVRRWALVLTGDPADAEDLTQDVLIQVIRRLDSFRGDSRFTSWVYSVTRNAAADVHRKRQRRTQIMDHPEADVAVRPSFDPDPQQRMEAAWTRELVRAFFAELPERQRSVLDLADFQGHSSPEIAEMLGIEPVSVRAHLFKARRRLRTLILERHPELAGDAP